MVIKKEDKSKAITELLNGTSIALKEIIPLSPQISKPRVSEKEVGMKFGVLIGITGDIRGKLVIAGDLEIFIRIGESMYDMTLEGDMLTSFSGELGNMLAGRIATHISSKGVNTDITSPTIIKGDTYLTGHKQGIQLTATYETFGELEMIILID